MTKFVYDHDGTGETRAVHPKKRARADVLRLRTAHRDQRINLALDVREVGRLRDAVAGASFWLRTDSGRLWLVDLDYWRGTSVGLTRVHANRGPREVDCGGLRGTSLPKENQYRVSLPRDCVKGPVWVRTGAVASFARFADPYRSWADHARGGGAVSLGDDGNPALGPRVRRG